MSASSSSASPCRRPRLDDTESSLDELSLLIDTAGAEEAARIVQRRDRPDPATFLGKGKVAGAARGLPRGRRRHRRLRQRAHAGSAVQPREAARAHGDRSHRGDPRHLRPERPHPRGQSPSRAGALALSAAPPAARPRAEGSRSRRVASARGVRARRSSRPTAVVCNDASPSSSKTSSPSARRATPSARRAPAAG